MAKAPAGDDRTSTRARRSTTSQQSQIPPALAVLLGVGPRAPETMQRLTGVAPSTRRLDVPARDWRSSPEPQPDRTYKPLPTRGTKRKKKAAPTAQDRLARRVPTDSRTQRGGGLPPMIWPGR